MIIILYYMLSSVNISYYMLFVYNNLGELHVGDRPKKKKKSGRAGQGGRTMVVERGRKRQRSVWVLAFWVSWTLLRGVEK